MELAGHHVFITGGASGIGLALAREFLLRGNRVTVCGRDRAKLMRAAEQNPALETLRIDLCRDEDLRQIENDRDGSLQSVSILVNNAAIGDAYCLLRDPAAFAKMEAELTTNLMAPIRLTRILLPLLLARKNAAVVNVTSGFAAWPCATVPGYSISKGGLKAFSRVLRNQLAGTNVKVFEVLPPMVQTALVKNASGRKISTQRVAAETIRGMQRDRDEICIGEVKLMRFSAGLFPGLLDWVIRRYPLALKELERLYPRKDN